MVHAVSKFGIEKKIVDIRHAITHQNCPDIGELRYATTVCLDWLWKNFWVSDARVALTSSNAGTAHLSNTDYEQRNREQQFDASLRAFKTWRHKNLSLSTELEWSQVSELHAIKNYILNDVTSFLTCFTKDQQLILTAHEWRQWKLPGTTSSAETWMVPEQIQSFWEPLFHLMLSMKLGAEIVISLLWRLKEQKISTTSSDQIRAYIRMMLTQFADADVFSPDEWVRILDHLLPVAKNFSRELIDIVMRNCPNLSRKRRNQVHQILTISNIRSSVSPPNMSADAASSSTSHNNTASTPTSSKSKNYHTMDDIQKLMRLRADKNEKPLPDTMTNPGTGIEKCESVDWMDVPFGMAPGQRIETFTVIVDIAEDGTCRKRKAFDTAITLE
uniref:GCFC domain-containing protein n=1 Tax=Caenorhabditis tropicalis TaxID=1561998 RepID=A0A1I7T738_9PELO